jgi:hypothetical protein
MTRSWGLLLCALACGTTQATLTTPATFEMLVPADTGSSELRVTQRDPSISPSDVDTCATCHSDVAEQWKTSAHFFASFDNPIYRASVLRFRKERGNDKSRFCGGCHDPSLMVDGAMDKDIAQDDLRAFSGVTCRTCHGVQHARPDGNASLDVRVAAIELPRDGDPDSITRHKKAAAPDALRTPGLCIGCHRVFLDEGSGNAHHLAGQDDGTPWMRSAYAGSHAERVDEGVETADCRGCHMPKEDAKLGDAAAKDGKITSHRFLGGHTWLASMRGDTDQLDRLRALLQGAATVDVADVRVEAERVVVVVVVKNARTGHRFPGGTLDADDTWVELRAFDARGRLVAAAGDKHAAGEPTFTPDTHVLRAVLLDDQGEPVLARETERFRTTVVNHTLAPRDAEAVEYELATQGNVTWPLRFEARLRHRSRSLAVQAAACAHVKTDESRAFDAGFVKNYAFAKALDPCAAEPIVDVSTASRVVGRAGERPDGFDRSYALGQGLLHVLQERLDEARAPLLAADGFARNPTEHAMALALLGQLASRQGRVDEAFAHLDDAQKAIGTHPFLDRVRGEVLASVWREKEADPYLCDAAQGALRDDGMYSELAVALGSVGQSPFALEAARHTLVLQPRDEGALRIQALALESLGAPADQVQQAKDAWLRRRTPDDGAAIKGMCSARVPGCAAERDPVRMHPMKIF